jgi:hypothetical protein
MPDTKVTGGEAQDTSAYGSGASNPTTSNIAIRSATSVGGRGDLPEGRIVAPRPLRAAPDKPVFVEKLDMDDYLRILTEPLPAPGTWNAQQLSTLRSEMSPTPKGWRKAGEEEMVDWVKANPLPVKMSAHHPLSMDPLTGMEIERNEMRLMRNGVDSALGAKVTIGRMPGFHTQTDDRSVEVGEEIYTYEESVQIPEGDRNKFVANVVKGPVKFADNLHEATFVAKKTTGRLTDISSGVDEEYQDLTFEAPRGIPVAPHDFTGAISEKNYTKMVTTDERSRLPEAHTGWMRAMADEAEMRLKAAVKQANDTRGPDDIVLPEPKFTPRLRNFLESVYAAQIEASASLPEGRKVQSLHNYFLYEPRTTYRWRAFFNLDKQERSMARGLFIPLSDDSSTIAAQAYQKFRMQSGNMPLNALPYQADHDRFLFPTQNKFHVSIIRGMPGAPMHDALTAAKGHKPGKGIGAFGVGYIDPSGDLDKNLAVFTRNGHKLTPSSNTLRNFAEQGVDFFGNLREDDLLTNKATPEEQAVAFKAFENGGRLSVAAAGFNKLYGEFLKAQKKDAGGAGAAIAKAVQDTKVKLDDPKPLDEFAQKKSPFHSALSDLKPLLELFADREDGPKFAELRQAHDELIACLKRDPAAVSSEELESRLIRLDAVMFDHDGYGGNRKERDAAL